MQIALISSTIDLASCNIKEQLLANYEFVKLENKFQDNDVYGFLTGNKDIKLYTINSSLVEANNLDNKIKADAFIFLSKHRAEGGRASLTVHPIGNFGKADYGGEDTNLCMSHPILLKNILVELTKSVEPTDYEATLEATHHGPYLEKPVLFLELGSNEKYWKDKSGALILVRSLMQSLEKEFEEPKTYFVVGGSHYNHVANKVLLQTDFSVSHICPKHSFENLNDETLKQALEKSEPKATQVLLDWKGLGKEKQTILELLGKNNVEYERSDQLFKKNK
ncbi:D-aminoacyl-tRNA deacylase [Candidatus Woesearchaeota archaeon]|nr:D-aminoacyl-tRNA deacylase [Candidatus Woesearchaeota archaeon]